MPNFACFGVIKQATTKCISFSEPLDKVPRNSTPGELAYTWQSKWVGIIRLKEHKFIFKAKFSLPSRRWTLKVPNNERPWYILYLNDYILKIISSLASRKTLAGQVAASAGVWLCCACAENFHILYHQIVSRVVDISPMPRWTLYHFFHLLF